MTTMEPLALPSPLLNRQPFLLGLFLPCLEGGWTISTAPRGTTWTFEYNREVVQRAENLGFDLSFQVGQWRPGYGGASNYRHHTLEPLTTTAALAAGTHRMLLLSTVHILYRTHPQLLAKQGANIDHISQGRWGVNIVTGLELRDYLRFGYDTIPDHDERYAMADEFVELLKRIWLAEEPIDFSGRYYRCQGGFVAPRPVQRPYPVLVNAGNSPAGREFAAKHCDAIFVTNPVEGGVNPRDWTPLAALIRDVRERAARYGRSIKVLINPHVICRETEGEAWKAYETILAFADREAAERVAAEWLHGPANQSYAGNYQTLDHVIVGGNVVLVGNADTIVEEFLALRDAGIDGVLINFFDYLPDLGRFAQLILPRMHDAGLRIPDGAQPMEAASGR